MSKSVLNQPLQSHPGHPTPPGLALQVSLLPPDDPSRPLRLRFSLQGDPAAVRWPAPLAPGTDRRRDGLWQQTCFEAFVALPIAGKLPYVEFNFAPSGAWAAYRFEGYRVGMQNAPLPHDPRITAGEADGRRCLEVATALPVAGVGIRLGLTAVLEAADGSLSYWALRHPPGRPDFHNEAGFLLELEV